MKKLLATLLAVCMALSVLPMSALAAGKRAYDDEPVAETAMGEEAVGRNEAPAAAAEDGDEASSNAARVGDTEYATLREALTAADAAEDEAGQTVTLLTDSAQTVNLGDYGDGLTNVTLTAADGVTVAGIDVRGTGSMSGFTFRDISFDSTGDHCVDFDTDAVVENVTFDGCTFTSNGYEHMAIRMWRNSGTYKNIAVTNCNFEICDQGVYVPAVDGLTVTGCTFSYLSVAVHPGDVAWAGKVTVSDNQFAYCGNAVILFNGEEGAQAEITGNTSTNALGWSQLGAGDGKTNLFTVSGNTWDGYEDGADNVGWTDRMVYWGDMYVHYYRVPAAAQLIGADGETRYATLPSVATALLLSEPGDTVKVLSLNETEAEGQFTPIVIPDDKAVQLECGEELAAEFEANQMDPALYLPAYFSYQAKTANFGGGNSKFALYGGVESGLAGENAIRTKGDGKTYAYTYVYLYKDWTLTGDVTLPSRNNSTTSIYTIGDAVTIDLNGCTLEQEASPARTPGASTTAGWDGFPAIIAYNGKTATVKDSSADKKGKVIGSAQTFDVYSGATLNLESGTFTTKGNWYNVGDYNGFGSIVRMDGGTLNISGGALTIPEDNDAHSVKMAATIMLRGKQAENPTRAYAINITSGDIETVPADKRADASLESLYAQNDGFVAINKPVIQDETYPNGENIAYAITGGTFDMDLRGAADAAEKLYLGEGYVSPEDEENEGSFIVTCAHTDVTVTREDEHEATCTEDGSYVEVTTCNICGHVTRETKAIEKLNHDMTKWAHDETTHWHVCSRCDAVSEETPAAHSWVRGTVSGGRRTDTCECGATRTVSVGGSRRPASTPPEEELEDPNVPLAKPFPFIDVEEKDWCYDAVKAVYEKGLMEGTNEEGTLFAPGLTTERGSVATLIHRMEENPNAQPSDFDDVLDGMWYTEAIHWADENGIMIGFGDGTFRPNEIVTREQLAAVFYRYAKFRGYDVTASGDLTAFQDADAVSDWAREAMAWAVGSGLIKGRSGVALAPQDGTPRGEMAAILQRFLEMTATAEDET